MTFLPTTVDPTKMTLSHPKNEQRGEEKESINEPWEAHYSHENQCTLSRSTLTSCHDRIPGLPVASDNLDKVLRSPGSC